MTTYNVTPANFGSTLASAISGDVLVLANGNYGNLNRLVTDTDDGITIQAENQHLAVFNDVQVKSDGLTIDGIRAIAGGGLLTAGQALKTDLADSLTITNSRFDGSAYFSYSSNLTITNNIINSTVEFFSNNATAMDTFLFEGNTVTQVGAADNTRINGNVRNGTIRNNFFYDANELEGLGVHPDMMQFLGQGAYWPENIHVRGNFIWDNPATGWQGEPAQGITAGGKDILIEENLVLSGKDLAISAYNGFWASQPIIIRNNIVFPRASDGAGGKITIGSSAYSAVVQNNVCKAIVDSGVGTSLSNNYQYTNTTNLDALYAWTTGGAAWQDYIPETGSAVDFGSGYGALTRLAELMGAAPSPPSISDLTINLDVA